MLYGMAYDPLPMGRVAQVVGEAEIELRILPPRHGEAIPLKKEPGTWVALE